MVEFDWDAANTKHLKRHRVSPGEFEELFLGEPLYLEYETQAGEERYKIPAFRSEAEEAAWWDKNRARLDKDLLNAAKDGELPRMDPATLKRRLSAAKARVVSIRLPEADIELARKQAAEKGLGYQTYIKSLLHQALRQAR